jgi:hypothetical protein
MVEKQKIFNHVFFREERFSDKELSKLCSSVVCLFLFHTYQEMPHFVCQVYVTYEKNRLRRESNYFSVLNDIPSKYSKKIPLNEICREILTQHRAKLLRVQRAQSSGAHCCWVPEWMIAYIDNLCTVNTKYVLL